MAVSSSVGPERPDGARPSIRFSFAVRVAAPAACLALLWLLGLAIALRAALAGRTLGHSHAILAEFGLLAVAGLAAIAAGAALTGSFGRGLAHDVTGLAAAAQHLAGPSAADAPGTRADAAALAGTANTAEVARAAAAIATLRARAAAATASESGLRDGLRQVFVSLAKRNQSLLQRQLRLIDTLEQKAADPAALADLFALDHLTTRMRRHAESLAILSGATPGRSWREPVAVIDVIRAAIAEVEDYKRVSVLTAAEDAVLGPAVADMIHLLAELIENATLYSPSGTRVEIRAGRVANGFAVEIDDRGLGIEPDQLREINQQLASPPDFDLADADRLGLFVGAKLAAKHGVRVSLRPSPYGGTSAIALLPNSIVAPGVFSQAGLRPEVEPRQQARPAVPRPARLDLAGAAALALTGRRAAEPEWPGSQPVTAPGPARAVPGPRPAAPGAAPPAQGPALGAPGKVQSAPGTVPGAPGTVPGAPGTVPGAPGTVPGVPGTVPGAAGSAPAAPGPDPVAGPLHTAGPPPTAAPAGVPGGTHAGLPRRTRQASLSPHLRDTAAGTGPAAAAPAPPPALPARTPERARDLAASVQSAWQRSRTDQPEDPPAYPPARTDAAPDGGLSAGTGAIPDGRPPARTGAAPEGRPPAGPPQASPPTVDPLPAEPLAAGPLPARRPAAGPDQPETHHREEAP